MKTTTDQAPVLNSERQSFLADGMLIGGEDRFAAPTRWQPGPLGLPLLTDATTHLICARHPLQTVGDHELVIGTVLEATIRRGEPPLLYHRGRYARTQ